MALEAHAPVVPVAVSGGLEAMRKGSPLIWPTTVRVELLPPVSTDGLSFDDRNFLVARVRQVIAERLGRATSAAG
jgi:1-acyl-sn-glycerol-3-phosphate acyltransferase